VTKLLGQKIQNFDGLGMKIWYFLELSPTLLKMLSTVGDGVNNLKALLATASNSCKRCRRRCLQLRLNIFSADADSH
jgi:hypothetical protein